MFGFIYLYSFYTFFLYCLTATLIFASNLAYGKQMKHVLPVKACMLCGFLEHHLYWQITKFQGRLHEEKVSRLNEIPDQPRHPEKFNF